jgi:hypothetical protein
MNFSVPSAGEVAGMAWDATGEGGSLCPATVEMPETAATRAAANATMAFMRLLHLRGKGTDYYFTYCL